MLLALIKSSTSVKSASDIVRVVSPTASRPDVPQDFSALPIDDEPGYIVDDKTDNGNPSVASAVKEHSSGTIPTPNPLQVLLQNTRPAKNVIRIISSF